MIRIVEITGNIDNEINTFVIPKCSAVMPINDKEIATSPQANPFMNPATTLLYLGKIVCPITIVTGWANIVVKPITTNIAIEKIGWSLYVKENIIIIGNVAIIEKYSKFLVPNINSIL